MEQNLPPATRRRNHASEIITSGPVWSAVWYLAWPTAINTIIQTAYNIINGIFVGRLHNSTDALAAIGIGGAVLMLQFGLMVGLSAGTSALVARFLGAVQYEDAEEVTRQSLILSVAGGLITGLPLVFFSAPIARLIGAQGSVVSLTGDYVSVIAWFSVPMFLYMTVTSALRSSGDARARCTWAR